MPRTLEFRLIIMNLGFLLIYVPGDFYNSPSSGLVMDWDKEEAIRA